MFVRLFVYDPSRYYVVRQNIQCPHRAVWVLLITDTVEFHATKLPGEDNASENHN